MRAIWTGEIAFGLVTIPAKLFSATKDLTPSFNQLHKECGTRISMVRRCPKCQRDVGWDEIGKGYEVAKGEYALFTKEELAKIEEKDAAGGIDIVEFVDPLSVDPAFFDKSYWVGPGGKSARGFDLLRQALTESKRVALAKVKIRTRTRLAILRPRDRFFALDMMRFADELVPSDEIVAPDSKAATDREMQLALKLVNELAGEFDPSKHPDEYRAAIEAAVDAKVVEGQVSRGEATEEEQAASAPGAKVIDLAELLTRSLKDVPKPGPKKTAPAEEAPAPAKKASGKKRG